VTEDQMISEALKEDIPKGDITTDALEKKIHRGVANLIAKEDLVMSGRALFEKTLHAVDPELRCQWSFKNGDKILNRQVVCNIHGNLITLLKAERVALNFLGRLSGIATLTHQFAQACAGTETQILDTRKTTPLYRALEKKAVVHGGGTNHRMNLSDAVMIKENHLFVGGGIEKTIAQIRAKTQLPIEVEVKNFSEVETVCQLDVQRIMLDNMSTKEMARCLGVVPDTIETEASGNMTLDRIPEVAGIGVNFISVGALTHSAPTADYSLLFQW